VVADPTTDPKHLDGPSMSQAISDVRLIDTFPCDVRTLGAVGDEVWVAQKSGGISIHDAKTFDMKHQIHAGYVGTFVNCFLPVGEKIWTGCQDGSIRSYNKFSRQVSFQVLHTVKSTSTLSTSAVNCLASSGTRIFSGGDDARICAWSHAGELLVALEQHQAAVTCFASHGSLLYSGDAEGKLFIWDAEVSKLMHTVPVCKQGITVILKNGRNVWCAGEDGQLAVITMQQYPLRVRKLRGHKARINTLVDLRTKILSGSLDRLLCIWSASTVQLLRQIPGHAGYVAVVDAVFKKESWRVWSAANDGTLRLWDVEGLPETPRPSDADQVRLQMESISEVIDVDMKKMKHKLSDLRQRLSVTQEQLEVTSVAAEDQRKASVAALSEEAEARIQMALQQVDMYRQELADRDCRIMELTDYLSSLEKKEKDRLATLDAQQLTHRDVFNKSQEMEVHLRRQGGEISDLRAALAQKDIVLADTVKASETTKKQCKELKEELQAAHRKVEQMHEETQHMRALDKQRDLIITQLEGAIKDKEQDLDHLHSSIILTKEQIVQLEEQLGNFAPATEQKVTLEDDLSATRVSLESLCGNAEVKKKEVADLRLQQSKSLANGFEAIWTAASQAEATAVEDRKSDLEQKIQQTVGDLEALQEAIQQRQKEIAALEPQLEVCTKVMEKEEALQSEIMRKRWELDTLQTQFEGGREHALRLRQRLDFCLEVRHPRSASPAKPKQQSEGGAEGTATLPPGSSTPAEAPRVLDAPPSNPEPLADPPGCLSVDEGTFEASSILGDPASHPGLRSPSLSSSEAFEQLAGATPSVADTAGDGAPAATTASSLSLLSTEPSAGATPSVGYTAVCVAPAPATGSPKEKRVKDRARPKGKAKKGGALLTPSRPATTKRARSSSTASKSSDHTPTPARNPSPAVEPSASTPNPSPSPARKAPAPKPRSPVPTSKDRQQQPWAPSPSHKGGPRSDPTPGVDVPLSSSKDAATTSLTPTPSPASTLNPNLTQDAVLPSRPQHAPLNAPRDPAPARGTPTCSGRPGRGSVARATQSEPSPSTASAPTRADGKRTRGHSGPTAPKPTRPAKLKHQAKSRPKAAALGAADPESGPRSSLPNSVNSTA